MTDAVTPMQRAAAAAHHATRGFRQRLDIARAMIDEVFDKLRHPYVAFSCGKDSSALLHLVATACPTATALMLTRGESRILFREIDDIFTWWRTTYPALDFREVLIDHVFADGWEDVPFWEQYASMSNEWAHLHADGDYDCVFLGLRNDEARMRRFWNRKRMEGWTYPIRRYTSNRSDAKAGVYVSAPLQRWSALDVEAYIITHDVPVLSPYYRDGFDSRTHTAVGQHSMGFGQLGELRRRDPEKYNELTRRFPELRRLT